jgi:hypothetical protein
MPDDERGRRRRRRVVLAICFPLLAAGLVATLSHAAARRTGTNGMPANGVVAVAAPGSGTICQQDEWIPSGTAAVRLSLIARSHALPPRLAVVLSDGDVAHRSSAAGARWDGDTSMVVPLARTLRAEIAGGSICVSAPAGGSEQYGLLGVATAGEAATATGRALPGRLHVEYLAAGEQSWWSFAPTLARRVGRGHAWSGPSVALLVALLMLAPIVLGAWQLSRGAR